MRRRAATDRTAPRLRRDARELDLGLFRWRLQSGGEGFGGPVCDGFWVQDYTKLLVWQRARALTVSVNEATRALDQRVAPGLRAQLMRATMSIAANIAEGAGRESRTDFARFVTIAIGSTSETVHHLMVADDLGLVDAIIVARLMDRATELRRMLFGLRRALIARAVEARSGTPKSDAP